MTCGVCLCAAGSVMVSARCGHKFCADCWSQHIETLVLDGHSTGRFNHCLIALQCIVSNLMI